LLFNFKGFGRSTIRGPIFADDILGVVHHVRSRFPRLPVSVIGLSFGGYHLVHSLVHTGRMVSAAMLDSVPLDARTFFRSFPLSWAMNTLAASRWSRELGIAALERVVSDGARFPRLLVVHGADDIYTSTAEIERFTRRMPTASLTTVPGAGHLECFRRDAIAYRGLLESLAGAPS
jgi:pimeloyl-ACP methyl ester carboxylesterase